jgi:hypothetical protein
MRLTYRIHCRSTGPHSLMLNFRYTINAKPYRCWDLWLGLIASKNLVPLSFIESPFRFRFRWKPVRSCETKELASWPKRMIMTGMLHPPAIAANIPTHINNRSLKIKQKNNCTDCSILVFYDVYNICNIRKLDVSVTDCTLL